MKLVATARARLALLLLALVCAFAACRTPPVASAPHRLMLATGVSMPVQSVRLYGAKGDGTTDDSAAFQRGVNALAGTGVALFVDGATFKLSSQVLLKSNLTIVMTPATVIDGTSYANVGHADASNSLFLGECQSLTTTTLTANASAGATQISVTANLFTVGGWLVLTPTHLGANASLRDKMYQVKAISGAGPYTITLDRAILNDYQTGDVAQLFVPLSNVRIYGNGATIKGVANRAIEMLGALDCYLGDINLVGASPTSSWTDYVTSWDVPSFRCLSEHLVIDGGQTALAGQAFEATEDCWAVRGQVRGAVFGYSFQDSNGGGLVDCTASDLQVQGANRTGYDGVGVQLGDDGSNGLGALRTIIRGGRFTACAFAGAYVQTASNETLFDGVDFSRNKKYAVAIEGDVATDRTTLRKCNLSYAGDTALYIPQPTVTNTLLEDCDLSYPTNQCMLVQGGPTTLRNCKGYVTGTATITGGASGLLGSGYQLLIDGGVYDAQDTGLVFLFQSNGPIMRFTGGVRLGVKHALSTCVATETGSSATAYVDHAIVYDSSGGAGANLVGVRAEAGHIYVGPGYDASAYPTYPLFYSAPGLVSLSQDGHVHTSTTTTGTETLDAIAARASVIKSAATLTGNVTINVPSGIPGLHYLVHNGTSGAFTLSIGVTGGTAITVAQGKRAIVESDGINMQRMTADQ